MPSGRYAPSPTGRLHIGNLRTALIAWLYARQDGSRFLLRFEDLDHQAVKVEHYQTQIDDLRALGLEWDEPVVRQSDQMEVYQDALTRLAADDLVYPCYCSRREIREAASAPNAPHAGHHYPGTCADLDSAARAERAAQRPAALRVRAQGQIRSIDDALTGYTEVELDDFVVQRNDGTPAYHLAVVLDDAAADIELVVRCDDLIESACRQLVLYEILGLTPPIGYAHVPLVLAPDGNRLAKRHGAVSLADRMKQGESPAEVLAFMAGSIGLLPKDTDAQGAPVYRLLEAILEGFDADAFAARGPYEPTLLEPGYLNEHDEQTEHTSG